MLELHKIMQVSNLVAFETVVILFYDQNCQGEVFKVVKNDHFLVFLAVWGLIPKFWGRLWSGL